MTDFNGFIPDRSQQIPDSDLSRFARRRYEQIFVDGYNLWRKDRYEDALKNFQALVPIWTRGPAAHVLLAHCQAMLGNYGACTSTLSGVFSNSLDQSAAVELHEAFVMWKCGLYVDAKADLEKVVKEHAKLPSPCLLLADLLLRSGNLRKPIRLLKLAIERDRINGTIAEIARQKLSYIQRMGL